MKSTNYSNFCLQIFGKFFRKYDKKELVERNVTLEKADIRMEYDEYNSMVLMNIFIGLIASIILSTILYSIQQNIYTGLGIVFIPTLTIVGLASYYIYLPTYRLAKRGEDIDRFLPYAVNFIGSMAVAGVSPAEIFQTLSTIKVYGELQTEAKRIAKEINVMGIDNITALKHAIELSPSKKFNSFIQGMIGTIQSGSDLHIYLATMSEKLLDDDVVERKKKLDLLAVVAETFVIAVIAFPIFLVIILSVMGFFGGSMDVSISILFLFAFLILPVIYLAFYYLVKSSTSEMIGKYISEEKINFNKFYELNKKSFYIFFISVISFLIFTTIIGILVINGAMESNIYLLLDILFIGFLILVGPVSFFLHHLGKLKDEIREKYPDFLVEVGDSLSSGMNAFEAIKVAEKGRYGKLSEEIKKMKAQLSWNIPIKDIFIDFSNRMRSGIIQRITITLNEGVLMGGNTSKIFKAAAKEVNQVNQIEHQRKANMSVYMSVILLCFFVFLAIILILDKTIFTSFFDIQQAQTAKMEQVIQINVIDPILLKYGLFSFVFVQSIGSGVLAGYLMFGRIASGLRYGVVLGIVSFIVFKLLF